TRLVEDFGRYAAAAGARVLVGRCTELGEDGPPFAPFVAALRELLRRDGAAAFAGYEADFSRLLPELAPAEPVVLPPAKARVVGRFPEPAPGAGRGGRAGRGGPGRGGARRQPGAPVRPDDRPAGPPGHRPPAGAHPGRPALGGPLHP